MSSSRLPTSLQALLERHPPPQLTPRGPFDKSLRSEIDGLKTAPAAVRASLHLANDDIDRAHEVAQADEGCETSNLTHAICEHPSHLGVPDSWAIADSVLVLYPTVHRREGDYWNSKVSIAIVLARRPSARFSSHRLPLHSGGCGGSIIHS